MTVALTPEIEARFQTFAKEFGPNPEQLAADLLTRAFNDFKETMDGLDRGVEGPQRRTLDYVRGVGPTNGGIGRRHTGKDLG